MEVAGSVDAARCSAVLGLRAPGHRWTPVLLPRNSSLLLAQSRSPLA
ncbi:hypothetical protein ANN_20858, partial [Periplaneta americana]